MTDIDQSYDEYRERLLAKLPEHLQVLQRRVDRLGEELDDARRLLRDAQLDAAEFKVGDEVEASAYGKNRALRPAVVRNVEFWGFEPRYKVSWRKKDGQYGVPVQVAREIRKAT